MFNKLKMPKMPKVKMPDVKGKIGKIKKTVGNTTKGAVKGIKGLNQFKK